MTSNSNHSHSPASPAQPVDCDDIRDLLYDYMARELGEMRSKLVREHLRHCPACSAEAAAITATLAALRETDPIPGDGTPDSLTTARRRRLRRLVAHPVLNWIDQHARIVALLVTGIILIATLLILRTVTFLPPPLDTEGSIPIWRYMRSGPLPEQVDRHFREAAEAEKEAP